MSVAEEQLSRESAQSVDDLAFFGKMCASISHEIKNCLAVISEQNGLHQDLLMLQAQNAVEAAAAFKKVRR